MDRTVNVSVHCAHREGFYRKLHAWLAYWIYWLQCSKEAACPNVQPVGSMWLRMTCKKFWCFS